MYISGNMIEALRSFLMKRMEIIKRKRIRIMLKNMTKAKESSRKTV